MKKLITVVVSLIIISLSIMFIFSKKVTFSENENRYLTKYPNFTIKNLISGKYNDELNKYVIDHFVLRDSFMTLKTKVDKLVGKTLINDTYIAKDNYLIMKHNKMDNIDAISTSLNDFYKKINYLNVEAMFVPTSISINNDLLPSNVPNSEELDLSELSKKVVFDKINVLDTLKEHNNAYQIFYRLDHHWTSYGAYYAYLEYCKSNNLNSIPINKFNIKEVTNQFRGTLYSKVLDSKINDSIYLFNYDGDYSITIDDETRSGIYDNSKLDTKDKYAVFLGGNYPIMTVTNNNIKINKELVLIKDSYANSIVPFLINHFKKIHIIDPRYYNDSIVSYIKNNNVKDVLILYNMETIDTDTGIRNLY